MTPSIHTQVIVLSFGAIIAMPLNILASNRSIFMPLTTFYGIEKLHFFSSGHFTILGSVTVKGSQTLNSIKNDMNPKTSKSVL